MRKIPPRQHGINGLTLFDHARIRQRAQLSPAARRLADRFGLLPETSRMRAELAGLTPGDRW